LQAERENNVQLHKDKAALEKAAKETQLKLVDLETKGYSSNSQDVKFLHGRIQEVCLHNDKLHINLLTCSQLEKALESTESRLSTTARSSRSHDRSLRDLQTQLERREKNVSSLTDDLNKSRDKIANLLSTIEELQTSDSAAQLATKRAERDLREQTERALRLEREVEGWKGLRFDRSPTVRSGTLRVPSYGSSVRGRRIASGGSQAPTGAGAREGTPALEAPLTETRLARKVSNTKGFL